MLIGSTVEPPIVCGDWLWTEVEALTAPPRRTSTFLSELQWNPSPVDPDFLAGALEESLRLPLHVWRGVAQGLTDIGTADLARAIRAPTMILWGDRDPIFGPEHQLALRAAIRGSRFRRLEGLGHNPHWERPAEVARLIASFVAERPRSGA